MNSNDSNSLLMALIAALVVVLVVFMVGKSMEVPPQAVAPFSTTVDIPKEDIQRKVEEFFVANGTLGGLVFSSPAVLLEEEGNRVGIKCDVSLNVYGVSVTGTLTTTGKLTYRPDEGAFYVNELEVDEISVDKVPALMAAKAKDFVQSGLTKLNPSILVHEFNTSDLKERAAKLLLKGVKVKPKSLEATVGYEL